MEGGQLSDRLAAAMTSVNLPSCTTPAAIELVQFNDRDRLAATLISLVRAEAKDEADAEERQPPPGRRQSKAAMFRNSQWMPEHLIALLPPPSNNEQIIRIFWNHVRTNSQHWPLAMAPAKAKPGGTIYVEEEAGRYMPPRNNGNMGWSAAEDQIIFDSTLRGDGWRGLSTLFTKRARAPAEIMARIEALKNVRLPAMWMETHLTTQTYLHDRYHHGEDHLKMEEWMELVIWVYNDYQGLNPAVFHHSRCTERLRKEIRVLDDLDPGVVIRAGFYFAAERARVPAQTQVVPLEAPKSKRPRLG